MARRMVYVYNGLGNGERSFHMMLSALRNVCAGTNYTVATISPEDIKGNRDAWQNNTDLLAFGGGYGSGFIKALGEEGMQVIRRYVEDGGAYLGVGAGGYFASSSVEFDKGGPGELSREPNDLLRLFPGKCKGPAFPGFEYNTELGARAATVSWGVNSSEISDNIKLSCYFNGGGIFDNADAVSTPIGTYRGLADGASVAAAAVKCDVGRGVAVLSGVHIEYNPKDLPPDDPYLASVIPKLEESEEKRNLVWRSVLKHLNILV